MAIVKILNNSMNPLGWRVGDTVEIAEEQGLSDLIKNKMVQVTISLIKSEEIAKIALSKNTEIVCPVCEKEFKVRIGLAGHMRSHRLPVGEEKEVS